MGVLGETISFMALLWCAPRFMQDRKSKNYNFTINYMELGRISLSSTEALCLSLLFVCIYHSFWIVSMANGFEARRAE